MTLNASHELEKTRRAVLAAGSVRSVTASRSVDAGPEAVWAALTDPQALPAWFGEVEAPDGSLQEGQSYRVPSNGADGEITRCTRPDNFALTWNDSAGSSTLTVALAPLDEVHTAVTITQVLQDSEQWERFGPGAVGVAWEGALYALSLFLSGDREGARPERMAQLGQSEQGRAFITRSAEAWGHADANAGTDEQTARERAEQTERFYLGEG